MEVQALWCSEHKVIRAFSVESFDPGPGPVVGNPVLQSFAVPLNQKARFSADGEAILGVSWAEIL
jgi:hypothetical protein